MQQRRVTWGWAALGCVLPGLVSAALMASQATVTFSCIGPGGLHFEGTGHEFQATEKGDLLVLTVKLSTVSTGIGVRDGHMQERYLESDKYPDAELAVPRAGLSFPGDGATVDATAAGTVTLHGISRPAIFHYKATRKGNAYDVRGDLHINMNDYGIPIPTYLGVTVRPGVDVQVSFRMAET